MTDIVRVTLARDADTPLLALASLILRRIKLLILIPFITFVLTVSIVYFRREYYAQSKLSPQVQESNASGIAGLAATLGMAIPTAGRGSESLDFYADLLKSREILDSVALTTYRFPVGREERDTLTGTYLDLYRIKGNTLNARLAKSRNRLARDIAPSVRRPSSLITLRTTARWPRLAEQINRRLLDLVNQFNTKRRQSQAGAERRFLEDRLDSAQQDLARARDEQRRFLEKNRVWQGDPRLSLEMQQLNEQVQLRQQVYETVSQSYEKARIDEVRNTPVITVVEAPEGSRRREGGLTMAAVAALGIGVVLAFGLAIGLEYLAAEQAQYPDAYEALGRTLRSTPGRLLRPGFRARPGIARGSEESRDL